MRPDHVPDDALHPGDVPGPDAAWDDVVEFGHRYHAYRVAGSLQRVAGLTLDAHERWTRDGTLPEDLPRLRLALFHTVRATHGDQPDEDTRTWARALLGAIRDRVRQRADDR